MTDVDAAIEDLKGWDTHYSPYEEMRDNAIAALEALRAENARLNDELHDAVLNDSAEILALTGENARLREALWPFADHEAVNEEYRFEDCDEVYIKISDLRAARAAMGESDE